MLSGEADANEKLWEKKRFNIENELWHFTDDLSNSCLLYLIWQTTSYFAFYDKMQQISHFSDNSKGMYFKCMLY